ncbi:hypothetical protein PAAG_11474 [Paracoccidioides lutzii Pb01]|uniref:Uncharacterized protein n=1 Tax=Paracoccidioides lutzii (strain ATCC MYA-826 / Pb01) TaxID=502779 RepID=A0A0A2V6M7_PARBA|nr:hypothetical protein PAAG_11474 [Paracoccidioides lutzii Pb01]KGQ01755.1 hypothetical protein PAAG_11474 [Paracoccidioides lutzii Pb01]
MQKKIFRSREALSKCAVEDSVSGMVPDGDFKIASENTISNPLRRSHPLLQVGLSFMPTIPMLFFVSGISASLMHKKHLDRKSV